MEGSWNLPDHIHYVKTVNWTSSLGVCVNVYVFGVSCSIPNGLPN